MWRVRRWMGWAFGTAVLAMAGAPPAGSTEQLLKPLPEFIRGIEGQTPLAGVSWSVIKSEDSPGERHPPMTIGQHLSADWRAGPSTGWLDLHGGRSRAVNREPDLWRHEF